MALDIKSYHDKDSWIKALLELPVATYVQNAREVFDPSKAVLVDMYEAGVTSPAARYPALGTTALVTCMGVAVHNPANGLTGLTHLVQNGTEFTLASEAEKSFRAMLDVVQGEKIQARLIGPVMGGKLAYPFIHSVVDILAEYDALVLSADFEHKPSPKNVAVHAALWQQGLIRGSVGLQLQSTNEGLAQRIQEYVNLENMPVIRNKQDGELCYNGLKDIPLPPFEPKHNL